MSKNLQKLTEMCAFCAKIDKNAHFLNENLPLFYFNILLN